VVIPDFGHNSAMGKIPVAFTIAGSYIAGASHSGQAGLAQLVEQLICNQ
jgi:hypothetical protein